MNNKSFKLFRVEQFLKIEAFITCFGRDSSPIIFLDESLNKLVSYVSDCTDSD